MYKNKLRDLLARLDLSLRRLYIMYICVFLLPLMLSLVLSNLSIHQLEVQVQKTAHSMNRQVQAVVDSRMTDIQVIMDQLNNHTTLRYMLNRPGTLTSADRYKCATIVSDLRRQYANTTMVESIFVYMQNSDSILSTLSRTDSRFFYENYYSYEGMSYETWMSEMMLAPHNMTVLPAHRVYNGVSTKRLITILQSLPRDSGVYRTGMAVLLIDENWLLSQIAPDNTYDREVYIFSSDGELILSSGTHDGMDLDPTRFVGNDGSFSTEIDGVSMHISYVKSDALGWTYALALPTGQFFSQVNELRQITQIALMVVTIIVVLLTALLAYVSFMPANSALQALGSEAYPGNETDHSQSISMRDLGAFVREALEDRSLYRKRLPLLIETYVFKLINGSRDAESELSLVSEVLGFRFPTHQFAVMSFSVSDAGISNEQLRSMLGSISALPDSGMDLYGTRASDDTAAVLISFWAGRTEEYRELLYKAADRLMRGLSSESGRQFDIGISLVGDSYEEINALYRQSLLCLAGSKAPKGGRITFYADVARLVPPTDYSYSLSEEKNLIAYVCAGDSLRMNKLLDEVFLTHEQEARMVEGMTQCLKFDMIGTLFRCAQEIDRDGAYERENWQTIRELMALEQPESIYSGMRRAFATLCDRAYNQRSSHNDDMRDRMIQYLAENYNNPDMGLDMAARAFGLAPSYLSRFFKEQTGGNFLDHVNRLRVEHAAQLLRTTDLPYSRIAEECGLSGSQALNRLFNRVLGVSPTTYRQTARDGGFDAEK